MKSGVARLRKVCNTCSMTQTAPHSTSTIARARIAWTRFLCQQGARTCRHSWIEASPITPTVSVATCVDCRETWVHEQASAEEISDDWEGQPR